MSCQRPSGVREVDPAEVGGSAHWRALVGPDVTGLDVGPLHRGPLVLCLAGVDEPTPLVHEARGWLDRYDTPLWVVCRVTRPIAASVGTLLEAGCAHRVARAISPDASWDTIGHSAEALGNFARVVNASAVMMQRGDQLRRRKFPWRAARACMCPILLVPTDRLPEWAAGRRLGVPSALVTS